MCKKCLQFSHTKKYCRSEEAYCEKCASFLHVEEEHECTETSCFYCKVNHIMGDRKELEIMNKMMKKKGILGHRKGTIYVAAANKRERKPQLNRYG